VPNRIWWVAWYARNIAIPQSRHGHLCVFAHVSRLLPLNPTGLGAHHGVAMISFLTNTDQQHYSSETTLSYLSQVAGLAFLITSAATGLAVGIAFIRGLTGRPLGNFYIDLTRSITRILLPISSIGAIVLIVLGAAKH